ncbi:leucine-rich repeat and IQ domain-containing protein 3 isoform X2 [Callorhinchus milii]|nr:leucine-rich repeat and IQ domain-containing protein 3 isoform X2 [Callorhinchus milii]
MDCENPILLMSAEVHTEGTNHLPVNKDFLLYPSKSFILAHGQTDDESKDKNLENIVMVRLTGQSLINMEYLKYCTALKICIMPKCSITDIDALASCPRLLKLDLHGNHINLLPDQPFWAEMKCLHLLYLHDNIISSLKNIRFLSCCPNLIALTMFDTPLSLKRKYRHYVVNNIISLKALDNFVIADEEIIEDWPRNNTFQALTPRFFVNLSRTKKCSTFHEEMKQIKNLIATINCILAHNSPVLIIQRWNRGYLTRKMLGKVPSISPDRQRLQFIQKLRRVYTQRSRSPENRKTGIQHYIEQCIKESCLESCPVASDHYTEEFNMAGLQIDRNKLQEGILEDLCEAKDLTSGTYPHIAKWKRRSTLKQSFQDYRILRNWKTKRHTLNSPEPDVSDFLKLIEEEAKEREELAFQHSKFQPTFQRPYRVSDWLLSRRKIGREMRMDTEHIRLMLRNLPKPKFTYQPPVALDSKLFAKSYGCMSFEPFVTIQKAYNLKEKAVKQALKKDWVLEVRTVNDELRSQVHQKHLEKCNNILLKRKKEQISTEDRLQQREIKNAESLMVLHQRKAGFLKEKNQRASEYKLAKDFNAYYSSMSKAFQKHERWLRYENILHDRIDVVHSLRNKAEQQRGIMKKMLKHKQLSTQAEHTAEQIATSAILFQAANDRLVQAKKRVRFLKTHQISNEIINALGDKQNATEN